MFRAGRLRIRGFRRQGERYPDEGRTPTSCGDGAPYLAVPPPVPAPPPMPAPGAVPVPAFGFIAPAAGGFLQRWGQPLRPRKRCRSACSWQAWHERRRPARGRAGLRGAPAALRRLGRVPAVVAGRVGAVGRGVAGREARPRRADPGGRGGAVRARPAVPGRGRAAAVRGGAGGGCARPAVAPHGMMLSARRFTPVPWPGVRSLPRAAVLKGSSAGRGCAGQVVEVAAKRGRTGPLTICAPAGWRADCFLSLRSPNDCRMISIRAAGREAETLAAHGGRLARSFRAGRRVVE